MKDLLNKIESLKESSVRKLVDERIQEFLSKGRSTEKEIFKELCFCLMTANFNAERSIDIQDKIDDGFCFLPQEKLAKVLRELGHRFPNKRAEYISLARDKKIKESRAWLVDNIKGLGMKEASHFLRNIGHKDVAIVDFHIVDLLVDYKLIQKPKTITPKKYIEIEELLRKISKETNLSLAELDLYLWYMETGKILK